MSCLSSHLKMLHIWSSFWTIRSCASLCSTLDINISESGIKSIQQTNVQTYFSRPPLIPAWHLTEDIPAVYPRAWSFLLLFAASNQSSPLFEERSIFALQICLRKPKPGRGDVMMAITYNALASCRCTEPILSRAMTSAWECGGNICPMI